MDNAELDRLRQAYKDAVEKWMTAIREEEALATPNIRFTLGTSGRKRVLQWRMHVRMPSPPSNSPRAVCAKPIAEL